MADLLFATDAWRAAFPGAVAGALAMSGVENPERSPTLEVEKRRLEQSLRERAGQLGPAGAAEEPTTRAYVEYYRPHGKTYHVKAQWESVALKGKPIPARAALVEAMFMAELENLILTAGHDLAALKPPVRVDVTHGGDAYVLMSGRELTVRTGDMMMADGRGIISTVLYGPDERTRINAQTREVFIAAYAPPGVGEHAVRDHLEDVRANVLLVAPEAQLDLLTTLPAG